MLEISESERKQALGDLEQMSERAAELGRRLEAAENERATLLQQHVERGSPPVADGEAVDLLVAAVRAAEDVRVASRARALRTLQRARELSNRVHAETERESAALAELRALREQIEREATEMIAAARAEADRSAEATADERHRIRELLSGSAGAARHGRRFPGGRPRAPSSSSPCAKRPSRASRRPRSARPDRLGPVVVRRAKVGCAGVQTSLAGGPG